MRDESSVERSVRLYCGLLRLYPAPYRRNYGPSMAQVLRDLCRKAFRKVGRRGILIALNLVGAGIMEAVTRTGGAVFGAVCVLVLAALLPLFWVPDSAAWLRENPINAAIIVIAASYIYQRSKKRWVLFATALILGAAQIGVSFI